MSESTTCIYVFSAENTLKELCFNLDSPAIEYSFLTINPSVSAASDDFFNYIAAATDLDALWVIIAGALAFLMQAGFAILEGGMVKAPNLQNILFKCIFNTCLASLVWYLFGYCVAFGNPDSGAANGFLGTNLLALHSWEDDNVESHWPLFFFQWAFAANTVAIISGAVAERCSITAYFAYAIIVPLWIYPTIVHWFWDEHGWISPYNPDAVIRGGAIDFAGGGVVHCVGGWAGLVGALLLKPRIGVFGYNPGARIDVKDATFVELLRQSTVGHNIPYQAFGTILLWLGWYGFNPGSTLYASGGGMAVASKCAVMTTLSAACGGISGAIVGRALEGYLSLTRICNGILSALVAITPCCAIVDGGSALAIGTVASGLYFFASKWLDRLRIDDPLDAWAVHGCAGAWGLIAAALFSTPANLRFAGYNDILVNASTGYLLGSQMIALVTIVLWTTINSGAIFLTLKQLDLLRIPANTELRGLDAYMHGGAAILYTAGQEFDADTDLLDWDDGDLYVISDPPPGYSKTYTANELCTTVTNPILLPDCDPTVGQKESTEEKPRMYDTLELAATAESDELSSDDLCIDTPAAVVSAVSEAKGSMLRKVTSGRRLHRQPLNTTQQRTKPEILD